MKKIYKKHDTIYAELFYEEDMLFKINQETLKKIENDEYVDILERKLENLIISAKEDSTIETNEKYGELSSDIFGEQLFFIKKQVATRKLNNNSSKYADIIALDKQGNGVIIELKKDNARLGVEMQALQYVVLFSAYKGEAFLEKIYKKDDTYQKMTEALMSFLNRGTLDNLNTKSRIILLASSFDDSVYAMGEWLDTQNVAFKCIAYEKYKINNDAYLSFSVAFDRSQDSLYSLEGSKIINTNRDPAIFFHIVHEWEKLIKHKMIPCGFEGRLNDRGTQIMRNYIKGDIIIAYKSRKGILGYGIIIEPATGNFDDTDDKNNHYEQKGGYKLYKNKDEDVSPICSPHTLKIKWESVLTEATAIKTTEFESLFGIYHPIQTSSRIRLQEKAKDLLKFIEERVKKSDK